MATRRQKYHSMIVASEKIVKSVSRDMDRFGLNNKHKDWKSVFKLDPHSMKSGRLK